MRTSTLAAGLMAGAAVAQRPSNTSICDYYTTALLKNNTAANQATVLTLLVNTVVIGNYSKPNIAGVTFPDVTVPGILKAGNVNGTDVNLLPYFDGGLASSNRGGSSGVAINFLDDGGATPLMNNKPADGTSSNQYMLLTHLYQFFGTLLQCSQQGMGNAFPSYMGEASMYKVHKFMDLDAAQTAYFTEQVGLAAKSFGVADADITDVANALNMYFNVKCAAPVTLAPAFGSQLQSICIAEDCPEAMNSSCSSYAPAIEPAVANSTLAMGEGNSSATAAPAATSMMAASGSMAAGPTGTSSGGAAPTISQAAAPANAAGIFAAAGAAVFAFFL